MSISSAPGPPDLAKYRLLGEIGHGGMATVYRAVDLRLGREVAIKIIHPHLRENPEAAARFLAEARAVAKLKHPGIVEIFDVSDESDHERFLVAELVRGPSLRHILKERGGMPPEVAACIGLLLCDALSHAHEVGIVHRDVKPENVLVEADAARQVARVKLTDFGIAKVIDAQGVTCTGQVLGSPAHMAPEQVEGGAIDARTDVFSLGVLLYECMVGHLPFEGKNPAQVLRRVLDGQFARPDVERPTIGTRWAEVVSKAISRDAGDRYAGIEPLSHELRGGLEAVDIRDPRGELFRYLDDPDAYVAEFEPRLVHALTQQARAARDRRDIPAMACALNRAVALAPQDAELLRLVSELAAGARRKRWARRVLVAASSFLIVAAIVFIAVKFSHPASVQARPLLVLPDNAFRIPPAASVPSAGSVPVPVAALASAERTATSATKSAARTSITEQQRAVRVTANVQAALVSIDGAPPVSVFPPHVTDLAIGPHTFRFFVKPENTCCEARTSQVLVEPGEGTQLVHGTLRWRQAEVSFAGGPDGARMRCAGANGSVAAGQPLGIPMSGNEATVSCFLDGSGLPERRANLLAGQRTVVSW